MLNNLEKKQSDRYHEFDLNPKNLDHHISSDVYLNHKGKIADAYYIQNGDLGDPVAIKSALTENGFLIINCEDQSLRYIMQFLEKTFGKALKDRLAQPKYLTKIECSKSSQYYLDSCHSQPLHTDGSYYKEFARFASLYCIRPAKAGGISTLVKVCDILNDLYQVFGTDAVHQLFQVDFIKFDSSSQSMQKKIFPKAILFKLTEEKFGMSFHASLPNLDKIKTTKLGYDMICHIKQFLHDPSNQYRIKLKKHDLLIMDNCRVFHARTAFSEHDNRLLLRIWNGQINPIFDELNQK